MSTGLIYLHGAIVLLLLIEVSWLWARLLAAREEIEGHRRDAESLDRLCQQQEDALDQRDKEILLLQEMNNKLTGKMRELLDEAYAMDDEEYEEEDEDEDEDDDDDDDQDDDEIDWGDRSEKPYIYATDEWLEDQKFELRDSYEFDDDEEST